MNASHTPRAIVFSVEKLETCRASGAEDLLYRQWKEISSYLDIPLKINWEGYQVAEDSGMLRIYTARVNAELVGYSVFVVRHNMHYSDSLQAIQDVIYIAPEHRKGTLGYRLIKYADQELAAAGAQVVYHHAKLQHPALGICLKRQGYRVVEHIWAKRLDKK